MRRRIADKRDSLASSQEAAQSGATHEQSRQEDPKDTRAIEAEYIARGLAARVETLREHAALLTTLDLIDYSAGKPIGATALVELEDAEGNASRYFLIHVGAGEKLDVDNVVVQVLTPSSPLGKALMGKREGDDVELRLPRGLFEAEILRVY